jgi:uncharacterized protein YjhX (UPF0386 family)
MRGAGGRTNLKLAPRQAHKRVVVRTPGQPYRVHREGNDAVSLDDEDAFPLRMDDI